MRSRREQVPFSLPEDRSKWFELVSWAPDVAEHLRRRWTRDAKTGRLGDICANELNAMHDAYSRARQLRATIVSQANSAAIIEVFDAFVRAQGVAVEVRSGGDNLMEACARLRTAVTAYGSPTVSTFCNCEHRDGVDSFVSAHGLGQRFAAITAFARNCARCSQTTVTQVLNDAATTSLELATTILARRIERRRAEERQGRGVDLRARSSLGSVRRRRVTGLDEYMAAYERGDFAAIGVDMRAPVEFEEAHWELRQAFPGANVRTYCDQLVSRGTHYARDLITAQRMHDEESLAETKSRIEQLCAPPDSESMDKIVAEWNNRHGPTKPTYCCGSCGVRDPSAPYVTKRLDEFDGTDIAFTEADYGIVQAMADFIIELPPPHGRLTFADLARYVLYVDDKGRNVGFWLDPKFVDRGEVIVCRRCWEQRTSRNGAPRGPAGSLARGVDYGRWTPSACEHVHDVANDEIELNRLETLVVSRTRRVALSCTIDCGYGGAAADHTIFSGHVVSFPQHTDVARTAVEHTSLTNIVLETMQNVSVTLTGPPASRKIVKQKLMRNETEDFSIRAKRVAIWFAITKALRDRNYIEAQFVRMRRRGGHWPTYVQHFRDRYFSAVLDVGENVILMEAFEAYMRVDCIIDELNTVVAGDAFAAAIADGLIERADDDEGNDVSSDVAGVRDAEESGQMTQSIIFDEPKSYESDLFAQLASQRRELPQIEVDNEERAEIARDDAALTEYGRQQSVLLEYSWPTLFVLPNSASSIRATNRKSTARLVGFYDNRFGNVAELFHLLHDMHVRHDIQRNAKLAVTEEDVTAFVALNETITDEDLKNWSRRGNDGSALPTTAQELIRIMHTTRPVSVPFTSAHRRRSAKKIRDMARAFGPLCLFWTFNPDDKSGNVFLRLTLCEVDTNDSFPVVDDERWLEAHLKHSHRFTEPGDERTHRFEIPLKSKADLLRNAAKHPARVAQEMERVAKSFVEVVLGVKTTPRTWVPKSECDPGVYGTCGGVFYVIEEDGRRTPHVHGGAFGFSVDPTLLEIAALFADIKAWIADWIRSVSNVTIPENAVVCREVERATGVRSDRTFGVGALPAPDDAAHAARVGELVATLLNHHRHCKTCDRRHIVRCRLCMPELHGVNATELCTVAFVPMRNSCRHDRVIPEVSLVSIDEGVDVGVIPIDDSVESDAVKAVLLDQYRCNRDGVVPPSVVLCEACPPAVNAPLVWIQSRPFVDVVRHEDDDIGIAMSRASLLEIVRWLESGPARSDDMRYHEVAAYLREYMDTIADDEKPALLRTIRDAVRCSHGYTAPYNAIVSGLLRCNTAMKLSGNYVSSEAQLAYTTEYVTKCPKIQSTLNSCARALQRNRQRGSTAEDVGTLQRELIYVNQVASQHIQATQGDVELSDTILAMSVAGADSDYFTCEFERLNQDRDLQVFEALLAVRARDNQAATEFADTVEFVETLGIPDSIDEPLMDGIHEEQRTTRARATRLQDSSDDGSEYDPLDDDSASASDYTSSEDGDDEHDAEMVRRVPYDPGRLQRVTHNMRPRDLDREIVMRYGYRGAQLEALALYFYAALYADRKRKGGRGSFDYDNRFASSNTREQFARLQFSVISFAGRGRPFPSIKQMQDSEAACDRFAQLVLLYFVPWTIDSLPDFANARDVCAAFLAQCESVTATYVERCSLELIRRLVRESSVPFKTKAMIQALRARHSDTLSWRSKSAPECDRAATMNGHSGSRRTPEAERERLLQAFLDASAEYERLTPSQRKKLEARTRFNNAFSAFCGPRTAAPADAQTQHAAAFWRGQATARDAEAFWRECNRVRTAFQTKVPRIIAESSIHGRTVPEFTQEQINELLSSSSASQESFLRSYVRYIAAINHAQRNGGVIRAVDRSRGRHGEKQLIISARQGDHAATFDLWRQNTLLLGGPGTGKTHTIGKLIAALELYTGLKACVVAPTGAAANLYVGRGTTVHTAFSEGDPSSIRLNLLQSLGCDPVTELGILVVDEVSMLPADKIHLINSLLRDAQETSERAELPFGGVPVVFVGDFFQLRPVARSSIQSLRLQLGYLAGDAPHAVEGAELLCKCGLRSLTEQMRASGDPGHALRLRYARAELSVADITLGIVSGYFEPLVSSDSNALQLAAEHLHARQKTHPMHPMLARLRPLDVDDADWSLDDPRVKVVCLDNTERRDLNHERALSRAAATGEILVRWRVQTPLTDQLHDIEPEALRRLYADEDLYGRHFWQTFVRGAECMIFMNYCVQKRVSNSTMGRFYGLVWADPERHAVCHEHIQRATEQSLLCVDLPWPPDEILVEFDREQLGLDPTSAWPEDETLVPGKVVLPFKAEERSFRGDLQVHTHGTYIKSFNATPRGDTHSKSRNDISASLFQVELSFAITQWKVQGSTLDRLVLWLAPRTSLPRYTADGLYVLFSRCPTADSLRYVPYPGDSNWDHIASLRYPQELFDWLSCFRVDDNDASLQYYDFDAEADLLAQRKVELIQLSRTLGKRSRP